MRLLTQIVFFIFLLFVSCSPENTCTCEDLNGTYFSDFDQPRTATFKDGYIESNVGTIEMTITYPDGVACRIDTRDSIIGDGVMIIEQIECDYFVTRHNGTWVKQ